LHRGRCFLVVPVTLNKTVSTNYVLNTVARLPNFEKLAKKKCARKFSGLESDKIQKMLPEVPSKSRKKVKVGPIANTQANRIAIVSSLISKIFNPCKHWKVTIQPSVLYVQ
jgi:hypothetical protein